MRVAGVRRMNNAVIFLDVEGVINPHWSWRLGDYVPKIAPEVRAAVSELAEAGQIVWATTYSSAEVGALTRALALAPDTDWLNRSEWDSSTSTPKLGGVRAWLGRAESHGEVPGAVVWIDDRLGPDVAEWAGRASTPVLLSPIEPHIGLTVQDSAEIRAWLEKAR